MSKVLYIKANIKKEGESRTFKVSDYFIEEYKKNNPGDEVIELDLYKENIDFLRPDDLNGIFGPKTEESRNHHILKLDDFYFLLFYGIFGPKTEESRNHPILKYAYQFAEADKYIIAAPMWNLSIPAILKAYIDYISVTGITFKYTAEGPVGLLNNKKAIHIVSRGGEYSNASYEMGDRYIRTILNFFGIKDITTLAIENVDVIGVNVEEKVQEGKAKAKKIVKEF